MAPVGSPNEVTDTSGSGDAALRTHGSTYRPGRSARSTVLQGAGRGGDDPRACSWHSKEGAGEAPEKRPQPPSENWAKGAGAEVSVCNT